MHRPVGDENGARAGIEESAAQAGGGFGARAGAGAGVARREHDPVGIELEREDFFHGQQAVAFDARDFRRGQRQRRLRQAIQLAGDQAVRGEDDDLEAGQIGVLDRRLVGFLAEMKHLGRIGLQRERDGAQFVGGIGQARQQREFGAVDAFASAGSTRRFSGRPRVATPSARRDRHRLVAARLRRPAFR